MTTAALRMVGASPGITEAASHAKLVDASEQFEAMMLAQMLKPLQFGGAPDAGGDESAGGTGDTVRGMATEALAKALSEHGGMGIARSVLRQVMAEEGARRESVPQKETGAKVQ